MWLSWLSVDPCTERSLVRFLVRHIFRFWVQSRQVCTGGSWSMFLWFNQYKHINANDLELSKQLYGTIFTNFIVFLSPQNTYKWKPALQMQGEAVAYNLVLHHKTFWYKNQYAALTHYIYIHTHNIFVSSYELSTYTYSFSRKLEIWAIPMLSSHGKINTTSLNVFFKRWNM